jgi:hypothetical protein
MPSKKIIACITTLLFLTSAYLFYVERRDSDPNTQPDWWIIYFQEAKSDNLDFTIENHSKKTAFHWEAAGAQGKIAEGDSSINKGEQRQIHPNAATNGEKKITITVSDGTDKKEIYKNFSK